MGNKKLFIGLLGLVMCSPFFTFAQTEEHNAACDKATYQISGPLFVKQGQSADYKIVGTNNNADILNKSTTFTLLSDTNKVLEIKKADLYTHRFDALGNVTLQSIFFTSDGCRYLVSKTIGTYTKNILYLGEDKDFFSLGFEQNFTKHTTLFHTIILSKGIEEKKFVSTLTNDLDYLSQVDLLIINSDDFDSLFQSLGKLTKTNEVDLQHKQIYVVTDSNKFFLKRLLAKYGQTIGASKIYTVGQSDFLTLFTDLSLNKDVSNKGYIKTFSLSFQETPKMLLISYFIDRLIYHGFPIELITVLLVLSLGALVVNIFRQIIGFSVFGIYSPLLFAVTMSVLGVPISLLLLGIGLVTKLLMKVFTKQLYLLHNTKTTLFIILYFFLIFIVFGLNNIFSLNLIDFTLFANGFVVFPIFFAIIISDKVFNEGFKIWGLGRWVAFAEFLLASFAVYGLFYRVRLKQLLLAFPELLLLIFVINIFVGRFTGLQFLEYFRFMPLIKKSSESEEE